MNFWLVNHSWESFRRTQEYCDFMSPAEQEKVRVGDGIVYFGQGLVFGVFEAVALVEDEFKGWQKPYPFQVKLKLIAISERGLVAKLLQDKLTAQKANGSSSNLLELSEQEFVQIKKTIEERQNSLSFV